MCDKANEIKTEIETQGWYKSQAKNKSLEFINKSFFDVDLSQASLVYINYTFNDEATKFRIEEKFLADLKPGTKIIAISFFLSIAITLPPS